MKFSRRTNEGSLTLNITALTDVAFLIIIFFMFSTHFARTQQRPMDLPKEAGTKGPQAPPASIIVEINRDGGMNLIGGAPMSMDELVTTAARAVGAGVGPDGKSPNAATAELVIRADRNCAARHINKLAGALARAGVRNWKLATAGPGTS